MPKKKSTTFGDNGGTGAFGTSVRGTRQTEPHSRIQRETLKSRKRKLAPTTQGVEELISSLSKPGTEKKTPAKPGPEKIFVPSIKIDMMELTLISDSEYISHAWSMKAKGEMLSKQMKEAKQAKEAKSPEQDYFDSLYHLPGGGYGMPASGVKRSAVDACSHVSGITKVLARGAFHVLGDFLPIIGSEPRMREDMVRIPSGADIRYRGGFKEWSVRVPIRYNSRVISASQIVNLFNTAGFAIGIGDWRPQRNGNHGMFHVKEGSDEV